MESQSPERFKRALEVLAVVRAAPPEKHQDIIAGQCGADDALRAEVVSLLRHEGAAAGFLSASPAGSILSGRPYDHIGPYKLLREIGRGGMGVVYLAERREPFVQLVALKLLRCEFGLSKPTESSRRRFDAERRALGALNHPSIARILDGGQHEDGAPYLVVEYVDGESITRHCDHHRLSVRDRLRLLVSVCRGVQHAHSRGIIHRDLKPGNVIAGMSDGRSFAKVIDFGLVKFMGPDPEGHARTLHGQALGTPIYMSPEQTGDGPLDIDARTDVYSLGVMLYELLTGFVPFDAAVRGNVSTVELMKMVRHDVPPAPSERLAVASADPAEADRVAKGAGARSTDPATWRRTITDELDWITAKAMEKDRERRYATASELAADLESYLADRALLAGPTPMSHKLGRVVRRHGPTIDLVMAAFAVAFLSIAAFSYASYREIVQGDRVLKALGTIRFAEGVASSEGQFVPELAEERLAADHRSLLLVDSEWHQWQAEGNATRHPVRWASTSGYPAWLQQSRSTWPSPRELGDFRAFVEKEVLARNRRFVASRWFLFPIAAAAMAFMIAARRTRGRMWRFLAELALMSVLGWFSYYVCAGLTGLGVRDLDALPWLLAITPLVAVVLSFLLMGHRRLASVAVAVMGLSACAAIGVGIYDGMDARAQRASTPQGK